jgi:hypothetical protein
LNDGDGRDPFLMSSPFLRFSNRLPAADEYKLVALVMGRNLRISEARDRFGNAGLAHAVRFSVGPRDWTALEVSGPTEQGTRNGSTRAPSRENLPLGGALDDRRGSSPFWNGGEGPRRAARPAGTPLRGGEKQQAPRRPRNSQGLRELSISLGIEPRR